MVFEKAKYFSLQPKAQIQIIIIPVISSPSWEGGLLLKRFCISLKSVWGSFTCYILTESEVCRAISN